MNGGGLRDTIADVVEAMIALLDQLDGDTDLEPEHDVGADDAGEREGDALRDAA